MKDHRFISALALALFALCVTGLAKAATGTAALSFIRPTTYVDGSALPATAITGYAVDCQFTATGGTPSACTLTGSPVPGSAQAGTLTLTYPAAGGQACFVLRTLVGTVSSAGSQPPVCKTFAPVAPSDPTNLTVTVTLAISLISATPIKVAVATPVVTVSP